MLLIFQLYRKDRGSKAFFDQGVEFQDESLESKLALVDDHISCNLVVEFEEGITFDNEDLFKPRPSQDLLWINVKEVLRRRLRMNH